jgi:hypothetical protein
MRLLRSSLISAIAVAAIISLGDNARPRDDWRLRRRQRARRRLADRSPRGGPACWFLGDPSANCTNTCAAQGLVYDPQTRSYAGSAGTFFNCLEVMTALAGDAAPGGSISCAAGIGYHRTPFHLVQRCSSPATTADAFIGAEQRACACMAPLPTPTAPPSPTDSATPTHTETPTDTATPTLPTLPLRSRRRARR